ncbi:MAG TPA: hypothetical protein VHD69_02250 [Candidatus Paceibacterota bacterium]|nr:hypothetical protein [Candidatus Paceibacterota bacterium]
MHITFRPENGRITKTNMSKYELRKTIKKELRDLNWRIDMKIVRGLPYRTEARRHKLLIMQLNRLSKSSVGFMSAFFTRVAA